MNDRDFDDDFDDDVDAFDPYDDEPKGRFSQGVVLAGAGFLTLVGFAAVVWAAYGQGVRDGMKRGPAIVEAPAETYRSRPEAPGGLRVQGQESEVLAQAAGEGEGAAEGGYDRSATRDLDALIDDQTGSADDLAAEAASDGAPGDDATTVAADDATTVAADDVGSEPADIAIMTAPGEDDDGSSDNRSDEGRNAETRSAPAEGPSTTPDTASSSVQIVDPYFVQIASYRSASDADVGWSRFTARNEALLSDAIGRDVERADLGERGVYHRLRAGPFEGKAAADAFCAALKAADQTCLVVAG